jgi:TRAP-type C4-dicarboxylate transport system permease small subunit
MTFWHRLDFGVASVERLLLVATLLTMMTLSVLQIGLRNLADTSWYWIDPFTRMLVLWLAILGAMVATRTGEHIAIDALRHYLSDRAAVLVAALTQAFAAFVTGLMAWHSVRFVLDEWRFGGTAFADLPVWPFELIMPLGFAWMSFRFTLNIFYPPVKSSL